MFLKTPPRNKGFTLIEVLVALLVLSVAAGGILRALNSTVAQMQVLERRTFGTLAASNLLTEMQLKSGLPAEAAGESTAEMAGRTWQLRYQVLETEDAGMRRVEVEVFDGPERAATLTGFLEKP